MRPVLTKQQRLFAMKNVRIPGRCVSISTALELALDVAGVLDDAGYRYVRLVTASAGFVLITRYEREVIRFGLVPEDKACMSGMVTSDKKYRHITLGVIKVLQDKVLVISDVEAGLPSLTLPLRRTYVKERNKNWTKAVAQPIRRLGAARHGKASR